MKRSPVSCAEAPNSPICLPNSITPGRDFADFESASEPYSRLYPALPGPLMSRWQTVVPLDYDVSQPLDEQSCAVWSRSARAVADRSRCGPAFRSLMHFRSFV
jgi:hypothetical protein